MMSDTKVSEEEEDLGSKTFLTSSPHLFGIQYPKCG